MNICIVGAGIHGLCCSWRLAKSGHDVTVYEQFEFGHNRGSSHGRSRIVRQSYPDRFYTEILKTGYGLWHELERESNRKLVNEVGLLYLGHSESQELLDNLESLRSLDIPCEWVDGPSAAMRWKGINWHKCEATVFTPHAGWVNADECRTAAQLVSANFGVKFVNQKVGSPFDMPHDRVILCTGAWITSSLPDTGLTSTLQTVAYIQGSYNGPVWIEASPEHPYGFPNEPGANTFKCALHHPGPTMSPDVVNRPTDEDAIAKIITAAQRRINSLNQSVIETAQCLYTAKQDEDFVIRWLNDKVLAVSPCSGHGFKFGPWIGQYVADLIEEKQDVLAWPRFAGVQQ